MRIPQCVMGLVVVASFFYLSVAGSPVYPLKASGNGRFLVDQQGQACLVIGDAPQALVVNISESDADAYFADRAAFGFNTLWVNLLCATYTGGRADASTIDGVVPFTTNVPSTTSYDLTKPNETYFAHVDRLLNLAAQHGIQVMLDPAETGSFLIVMLANGANNCREYGRFLGARYRTVPNLIWMSGNDFQTWRTAGYDAVVRAVALGIRDNDTNHLQTTELDYLVSSSLDDSSWNGILGLNATYTYYPTYARLQQDFNRTNFLPTFLVEANYEFESLQGPVTTAPILRQQEYWTMTSGACGQLYGNHFIWPFATGWQANLDTPGATQISYLKTFFETRQWYDLVPDTNHLLVTTGYGTFSSAGHVADNDYLTAAGSADGSLAVIYTPILRTFTVDLSKLSGPAVTRWFDPSSGSYTAVIGSPLTNAGTVDFTPPGNNNDGDGGWVLVLETNAPPEPPPPPPRPKFVQQSYAVPQTPQSQVSVSFPQNQTSGNANILAIGWNDTIANISSVHDAVGNVYQIVAAPSPSNNLSQAIYFSAPIKSGSNTVTVTFDRGAAYVDLRALEYSGLEATSAFEASATGAGLSGMADSGPVSLTASNELLFAAGMTATAFLSAGNGFTTRVITSPDADLVADRVVPAPGQYNATATLSSGAWLMQLAAFRAATPPLSSPTLRIVLTSTNTLFLAWPTAFSGFALQQNPDLTPGNWIPVTNAVTGIGTETTIVLSLPQATRFYRLNHP